MSCVTATKLDIAEAVNKVVVEAGPEAVVTLELLVKRLGAKVGQDDVTAYLGKALWNTLRYQNASAKLNTGSKDE